MNADDYRFLLSNDKICFEKKRDENGNYIKIGDAEAVPAYNRLSTNGFMVYFIIASAESEDEIGDFPLAKEDVEYEFKNYKKRKKDRITFVGGVIELIDKGYLTLNNDNNKYTFHSRAIRK